MTSNVEGSSTKSENMKPLPLNDSVMVKGKRFRDDEGRDLQLAAEIEEKGKELSDGGALKDLGFPDGGNGRRRNPVWVLQDLGCRERSYGVLELACRTGLHFQCFRCRFELWDADAAPRMTAHFNVLFTIGFLEQNLSF
ncbi:hypothetical protein Droror1_Dr00026532 [Drosera rotundifolia]